MSYGRIAKSGRLYLSMDILRRIFATFVCDLHPTLFAAAIWEIYTTKSSCKSSRGCCTPYSFADILVVLN